MYINEEDKAMSMRGVSRSFGSVFLQGGKYSSFLVLR